MAQKISFILLLQLIIQKRDPKLIMIFLKKQILIFLMTKKIGDLMQAEQIATMETFRLNNFSFREIFLPTIDEYNVGKLLCLSIIETIASCIYFDVNPFDQPAVEQGKILTKKFLL